MRIKIEILSGEGAGGHGEAEFDLHEDDYKTNTEFKTKIVEFCSEIKKLEHRWKIDGGTDNTAFISVTSLEIPSKTNQSFLRKIERFIEEFE